MKKALKKYLLTICILLLNGYGCLHAFSDPDSASYTAHGILANSLFSAFCDDPSIHSSIFTKAVSDRKDNPHIYYEETEEKIGKLFFLRTYTESGNYFTTFFSKVSGRFFDDVKTPLPVFEHWFYSSSHRYSALRVLRI